MTMVTSVKQTDLVYTFLKAFKKKLSWLKRAEGIDPTLFKTVAHFMLHNVVKRGLDQAKASSEAEALAIPSNEQHAQEMLESAQQKPSETPASLDDLCKLR